MNTFRKIDRPKCMRAYLFEWEDGAIAVEAVSYRGNWANTISMKAEDVSIDALCSYLDISCSDIMIIDTPQQLDGLIGECFYIKSTQTINFYDKNLFMPAHLLDFTVTEVENNYRYNLDLPAVCDKLFSDEIDQTALQWANEIAKIEKAVEIFNETNDKSKYDLLSSLVSASSELYHFLHSCLENDHNVARLNRNDVVNLDTMYAVNMLEEVSDLLGEKNSKAMKSCLENTKNYTDVTESLWDKLNSLKENDKRNKPSVSSCKPVYIQGLDWLDKHGVSVYKTQKGNYFLWQDRQVSHPCGINDVPRYVAKALYSLLGVKSDEHFTVLTDTKLTKVICNGEEKMLTAKGIINYRHKIDKVIGAVTDFEEIVKHTDEVSECCRCFYDTALIDTMLMKKPKGESYER